MAHFAKIGLNNKVIAVHVVKDEVILDADGNESEINGINYLTNLHGWSIWKQTSYNGNIRKNFAGIGDTYDEDRDAFIKRKPYASWILNEETCQWEAPIEKPTDTLEENQYYGWNEENLAWEIVTFNI